MRRILNTDRARWFIREDVPLWPRDKWVCTEFHGLRMWVNMRDTWLGYGPLQGAWEEKETEFVLAHLKTGGVFLDVGTNVGPYTLRAAKHVGAAGRVYGFEPRPDTAGMLQRSLVDNGMDGWVTLYPNAVGDKTGSAFIHMDQVGNQGNSFVRDSYGDQHDVAIEVVRLDDVNFDRRVEVMKMDVEGFDARALRGAKSFISKHKPVFIGELFPRMLREMGGIPAQEYVADWTRLGYTVRLFDHARGAGDILTPDRAAQEDSYPELTSIVAFPAGADVGLRV